MLAPEQRARIATEVIELGEQLFALALEGQSGHSQTGDALEADARSDKPEAEPASDPAYLQIEIEAASEEFFQALRLLLDVK